MIEKSYTDTEVNIPGTDHNHVGGLAGSNINGSSIKVPMLPVKLLVIIMLGDWLVY